MSRNRITSTTTLGGHRDVLDDIPVHAGAILELWHGARWVLVRYECDFRTHEAWLVLADDTTLDLDRERMLLRWPGDPRYGEKD